MSKNIAKTRPIINIMVKDTPHDQKDGNFTFFCQQNDGRFKVSLEHQKI